jgi:putative ABC transport system permease protein
MIALFSINLRIMGRPNVAVLNQETVLTPFYGLGVPNYLLRPLFLAVLALVALIALTFFLSSRLGLAMRASGINPRMARAQGVGVAAHVIAGIALSNALVALGGALFAQTNGFADVTAGIGTIVVGLAAVIVGETLLPGRGILVAIVGCLLGSVLYRLAVQFALNLDWLGLRASDLNLATALLVLLTLILPRFRKGARA